MKRLLKRRRGIVLIVVLLLVTLLSLAAGSFTNLMISEHHGAKIHGRLIQARAFSDSGIDAVKGFLMQDPETLEQAGGVWDNPATFQGILVVDAEQDHLRGRFSILAPLLEDGQATGVRFGLEDESVRLNLNALVAIDGVVEGSGRQLLMGLPGMTEEIADAILDWIDPDDEPREYGAEIDYYASQSPAYAPKNGPLESVEELLLVRDVTPWLMFGADGNRNGLVDEHEMVNVAAVSSFEVDGSMDRGWSAYLTLYSMERNAQPDGSPRINLNNEDLVQLHEELSEVFLPDWVTYIVAYRQNGPYRGDNEAKGGQSGELDLTRPAQFPLKQVLDLIGDPVQVQFVGADERVVLASPFVDDLIAYGIYLPLLMDHVTVNPSPTIPGRINVNQAPRATLMGVPGMDETIVDQIISTRGDDPTQNPAHRHETWLLAEGIVALDEMRLMTPYVCGGGAVFRAQSVGYFDQGGPATRVEAVIDATRPAVELLFYRDISHLGRGYPIELLGTEARQ